MDKIPLNVIIRGLEAQYSVSKSEYWASYLVYFYYEEFKKYLNEEKFEKARVTLEKAKGVLYDYRYHFYYGLLFSKLGDYENAEVELKRSISMNETFSLGYYELGNILYLKKDYDEAVQSYLKAFELNKDFALPLLKLGDTYFESGQLTDAEIAYKSALKVEKLPEIYLRLGVLYNEKNQFNKAEKMFREGLSIEYKPEIAYNLSYTLSKLGKHFQAMQILKELVKNFPAPEVFNELGIIQKNLGLYEEAIESLKNAGEQFEENYIKARLFIEGITDKLLMDLKKFDSEYAHFLENAVKSKESIEDKLTRIEYPFKDEISLIFNITDDMGEINIEEFMNILGIKRVGDKRKEYITYLPYVLSGIYISGGDPILIEKNATKTSVALYGDTEGLLLAKALTMTYIGFLFTSEPLDSIIQKILEQVSFIHYPFYQEVIKYLEENRTSMEDFIDTFSEPSTTYEFIKYFLEILSYEPIVDDISPISSLTFGKILLFLLKVNAKT
ncbi:tetratricopeptide repeat protein [Thermosipho ferrireducens]|uniref:Tetratricopeptide repeat protein n=2 Tax=Thermosipho ferrireducens TaxID=2571116 RepID=A0ABX7SAC8_9BACT|nr:tetratricopeptide repeat protein [Thermosipho ferrireducens]